MEENPNEHIDNNKEELDKVNDNVPTEEFGDIIPVSGLYKNWFLEYASYVILERAIPSIDDGLKPVQRRIMHAMFLLDDGRFNKVANVIGSTMQFHPHGDAAIGDALVHLGQKNLLMDTQGNWGDTRTGDRAAAPRYIEARLSKFALDVAFNKELTEWKLAYDGRKEEPVNLPMKFPVLLAQGVEGIAVGLSTKIMPHNFVELCKASIQILKGKNPKLVPDFLSGGSADFTNYNDGERGGKIKVRATVEKDGKNTLKLRDIPYGTTTTSVIDSILRANDKGKIKVKKVIDNTAAQVEIEIQLPSGVSSDKTIEALYAFTDCEISISPNACIIIDDKPHFTNVTTILKHNTEQTLFLLKRELQIRLLKLQEQWHYASLEKIFIENRIYRDIEECETWEAIIETIDKGLEPYKPSLNREVTVEDITRLTEIKIKRISKFDSFKADETLKRLLEDIESVKNNIKNIVDFSINFFETLLKKYGNGRERKTQIVTFDTIKASVVAQNNVKLYVNYKDGFAGFGIKKEEFVCECSDLDDIIVFRKNGKYSVSKISQKNFVGKNILHIAVFRKNDDRTTYNLVYLDGTTKRSMVKRFQVKSIIRDREYDITAGTDGSKVTYFTVNPNGEAEKISLLLSALAKARNKDIVFDFSSIEIKGRNAKGNILSRHAVKSIKLKEKGKSTIGGRIIHYDKNVGKINIDGHGEELGEFFDDDKILVIHKDGNYQTTDFSVSNRFDPGNILLIQKLHPDNVISAIHQDGKSKNVYLKRFHIETQTDKKKFLFISENPRSKLILACTYIEPEIELTTKNKKGETSAELLKLNDLIDIKGWKSVGNKITYDTFRKVKMLTPLISLVEDIKDTEAEKMEESTNNNTDKKEVASNEIDVVKTTKSDNKENGDSGDSQQIELFK